MARKKSKFKPRKFERIGSSNLSVTLYASMLQSNAWSKLGKSAQSLYLFMKLQLYGQAPLEGYSDLHFEFNKSMYMKTYHLYTKWAQFDRDRQQLVQWGFIEESYNGANTRTKNIYKFSDKWQDFEN